MKKLLKHSLHLVLGFLFIPGLYLGFILATNSSKGWNVNDVDGVMFIPVGIILILATLSVLIFQIKRIFTMKCKQDLRGEIALYLVGIVAYFMIWCFY